MKHYSRYALQRCSQRGVSACDIELALLYGTRNRTFSDTEYVLTDRCLLKSGLPERLRGLCVIVTSGGVVKTVMFRYKVKRRPGLLRRAMLVEALELQDFKAEISTLRSGDMEYYPRYNAEIRREQRDVRKARQHLTSREYLALEMKHEKGYTYRQMAKAFEISLPEAVELYRKAHLIMLKYLGEGEKN